MITFYLITMNTPYAHTPRNIALIQKNIMAPNRYIKRSIIPKLAKVITLRIIGANAFRLRPSMNADIYLGGRIPARPTIEEFKIAMHMPKDIMKHTEMLKARSASKR